MKLFNNLRMLRLNKNQITQKELAEEVNVSRQTIQSIESRKFNPSVKLALIIAIFFEVKVEDVFYIKKKEDNL